LNKAFSTNWLIATSRMIDIGWIELGKNCVNRFPVFVSLWLPIDKLTKKQIGHSTASLYKTFSLAFIRSMSARCRSFAESTAKD
jgi:hypothetical protein